MFEKNKSSLRSTKKCNTKLKICLIVFGILLIAFLIVASYFSYIWFYTPQVNCRCKLGINKFIIGGHEASKNCNGILFCKLELNFKL